MANNDRKYNRKLYAAFSISWACVAPAASSTF